MKNFYLPAVLSSLLILTACNSSKNAASSDYQYQQWLQQQQNQNQEQENSQQRPGRTLRASEPCIELAQADSENLRAYGTSTSYVEKAALNEAERDARNRLAAMLKVAVMGAALDYEQNANKNLKKSAGTIGESIMNQFVVGEIKNTRIIKTDIYDLTDGSIQVYVCLEMRSSKNDFENNLNNMLEREGIIELQYDRDRFIEKMAEGLEEYKEANKQ